jgi:hypothetical protein
MLPAGRRSEDAIASCDSESEVGFLVAFWAEKEDPGKSAGGSRGLSAISRARLIMRRALGQRRSSLEHTLHSSFEYLRKFDGAFCWPGKVRGNIFHSSLNRAFHTRSARLEIITLIRGLDRLDTSPHTTRETTQHVPFTTTLSTNISRHRILSLNSARRPYMPRPSLKAGSSP